MPSPKLPAEGGCRCGELRFRVTQAPILTMACHCTGCQRMTGGAYSLGAACLADAFTITKGEPVLGGMRASPKHNFCPHCMSWVFTRIDDAPWIVNVRATMFDDASWFAPFIETCASEALPWAKTPAPHSFANMPKPEDFQRLAAEYAAQSGA